MVCTYKMWRSKVYFLRGTLIFSLFHICNNITSFAISLKRKGFTTVTFLFSFATLTQHMSNRWFVRFINVWIFWMGKEPGQDKTWLLTVNYVCLHQKLQIARTWLGNVFELDLEINILFDTALRYLNEEFTKTTNWTLVQWLN